MRYHDFQLNGYEVSERGRRIKLHLSSDHPDQTERVSRIEFRDVVCYHFSHTADAIITDIEEEPLPIFVKKEENFLVSVATQDGLRLWHSDVADYLRRLEEGGYHAWRLGSATGFSGFIVAQSVSEKGAKSGPQP